VDDLFTDTVPNVLQAVAEEDTADTAELPELAPSTTQQFEKYAKAFLRFYRARRILSGNRNINTVTRERALYAWQYLATLAPNELPPALREPYREVFELASQLDQGSALQSPVKLVANVLKLSLSIDETVDDLLAETEKPST
jgi:hypothetical protein